MKVTDFNNNKINDIKDVGLKNLVKSLWQFKGVDGVKIVQEALNMSNNSNIKVDGWFGNASIKELERTKTSTLNKNIGILLDKSKTKNKYHRLSKTSLKRLKGVHPDIVKVVKRASLYENIFVVEGLRSQKRQNKLKKKGNSQISRSYHLYGLAVDLVLLVNGKIDWNNKSSYKRVHKAINMAEKELGMDVLDNAMFDLRWRTLTDYPHWQMHSRYVSNRNPRKYYANKKGVGFV